MRKRTKTGAVQLENSSHKSDLKKCDSMTTKNNAEVKLY